MVEYLDCQDCGSDISGRHFYCASCGDNTMLCSPCRDNHRERHEGAELAGVLGLIFGASGKSTSSTSP